MKYLFIIVIVICTFSACRKDNQYQSSSNYKVIVRDTVKGNSIVPYGTFSGITGYYYLDCTVDTSVYPDSARVIKQSDSVIMIYYDLIFSPSTLSLYSVTNGASNYCMGVDHGYIRCALISPDSISLTYHFFLGDPDEGCGEEIENVVFNGRLR